MARRPFGALALLTALSLTLAACGSSGHSAVGSNPTTTTVFSGTVPQGGTLTIAAEQPPSCFDWLDQCSASIWGYWMAQVQTIPLAFVDEGGGVKLKQVPGPVLAGMPTETNTPVQTITYKINPAAHWSDKVPITCADFQYTANQELTGSNLYDTTGYTGISTVKCPDPKTVVVTFKKGQSFASWQQLFASDTGIYPSHILKGKNRHQLMAKGFSWSGGPWVAKWNQGQSVVLTPNPNYWGAKPKLDKVVFQIITNTSSEFQAFRSGQVDAVYPQPEPEAINAISQGLPDTNAVYSAQTGSIEALWLNVSQAPFDSLAVRQALGYAIDRDGIVKQFFGKLGVTKAANSLNPSIIAAYSDPDAFAKYHLDLPKVSSILTAAGWAKGTDGIWAKDGKKLSFTLFAPTGDEHRLLTETALGQQLKTAGFDMKIDNKEPDDLYNNILPAGTYQAALYGQGLTSVTPGLCVLFCTKNIPSAANQNSGANTGHVSIPALDQQLEIVDDSMNDAARREAAKKADDLMAENMVSLPLDPLPDILLTNKKVVGPIADNAVLGPFWNINLWGVKQ